MSMDSVAEDNYKSFMRAMERATMIISKQILKEIEDLEHRLSQKAQDRALTKKIDTLETLNSDVKNQISYLEFKSGFANFEDRDEQLDNLKKDLDPFRKESPTIDYALKNKATLECMVNNLQNEIRKPNPSLADLRKENKAFIHARAELKDKTFYRAPDKKKPTRMSFDAACKNAIARAAKAAATAPARQAEKSRDEGPELSRI